MRSALATIRSVLATDEILTTNQYLRSPSGKFFLWMKSDGNLVEYKGSNPADIRGVVWASNTMVGGGKFHAWMQADGNFVVYTGSGSADRGGAVWASNSNVTPGGGGQFFLSLQDDGNLVVYSGTGIGDNRGVVWATNVFSN